MTTATPLRSALSLGALIFAVLLAPGDAHAQAARSRGRTYRAPTAHRTVRRPAYSNGNVARGDTGRRSGYGTSVVGGRYVPGYGVIGGGYPGSYPVVGGLYAPGFGVMGTPPTPVVGGSYIPGFGVTGGAVGSQKVQGGSYIPGYGVR